MSRLSVFLFGAVVLTSATVVDEATYIIDAVNGDPAGTWTVRVCVLWLLLASVLFNTRARSQAAGDGGDLARSMGVWPRNGYASRLAPVKEVADEDGGANEALAETFDARERWPECSSLLDAIKDQSNCGSCWVSTKTKTKPTDLTSPNP